jgi:TrbL/VirB6 plasmid conjugal transfer protein
MTRIRLLIWLSGVLIATLIGAAAGDAAFADPLSVPTPPGLDKLLADPGQWLTDMFNAAVMAIGSQTTDGIVQFLNSLGSGSIITRTPPELSYDNAAVKSLSSALVMPADVGLAAIAAIGGINIIIHPHIRAPYHGALELVPRVLLGAILVNFSLSWGRFAIDFNNAICQSLGGASMPSWADLARLPSDGPVLLNLVAMAVYLVMGMLLVGQMLMRLALVDALLVIAPLALLCWILPQTYAWARLWFTTFFGTVFVQAIQVLVLRLGADLIQSLVPALGSLGSNPLAGAHAWLMTLLLGMAVLQLTRKIPRIVQGVPAGMGTAYTGPSIGQLAGLFSSGKREKSSSKR